MAKYYETKDYALKLAEDRLTLLLGADLPGSDHPSATRYVIDCVRAARLRRDAKLTDHTPEQIP